MAGSPDKEPIEAAANPPSIASIEKNASDDADMALAAMGYKPVSCFCSSAALLNRPRPPPFLPAGLRRLHI